MKPTITMIPGGSYCMNGMLCRYYSIDPAYGLNASAFRPEGIIDNGITVTIKSPTSSPSFTISILKDHKSGLMTTASVCYMYIEPTKSTVEELLNSALM